MPIVGAIADAFILLSAVVTELKLTPGKAFRMLPPWRAPPTKPFVKFPIAGTIAEAFILPKALVMLEIFKLPGKAFKRFPP